MSGAHPVIDLAICQPSISACHQKTVTSGRDNCSYSKTPPPHNLVEDSRGNCNERQATFYSRLDTHELSDSSERITRSQTGDIMRPPKRQKTPPRPPPLPPQSELMCKRRGGGHGVCSRRTSLHPRRSLNEVCPSFPCPRTDLARLDGVQREG